MDATQFQTFIDTFTDTMKEALQDKGKGKAGGTSTTAAAAPKITLRIPMFKEEPGENVEVWLRQTKNILYAQGVDQEGQMIHYAATGFEGPALHWFVNKLLTILANPTQKLAPVWISAGIRHPIQKYSKPDRHHGSIGPGCLLH